MARPHSRPPANPTPLREENMDSPAFESSSVQDSTVISNAFNRSVMAHKSPIYRMSINNFYGESGRSNSEYRSNEAQQARPRVVTFVERQQIADRSKTSQIPVSISRLLNRDESAQESEPISPIESGYSVSGKATTTGVRPPPQYKAVAESRRTMQDKLKLRVEADVIREYMQSDFFCSRNAIPLWEPSPGANSRKGIKDFNVCVGDVGFFTQEGGFHVLFNTFLSYNANRDLGFKPPDDFEPYGSFRFSEDVSTIIPLSSTNYTSAKGDFDLDLELPHHPERKYIRSYHLVEQQAKARRRLRSGTLLDLPNGVWKDRMLPTVVLDLQGYFDLHAEGWYSYYLERLPGPIIPKGDLNIISTSYKCSSWALAICSTTSRHKIFARLYQLSPDSEILYEWDKHGAVDGKRGPPSEQFGKDGLPLTNQCVAVEVYSIERTKTVGASISRFMSKLSIRSRSSTIM